MGEFDPSLVPHIIEFGKRISTADADVLVLMARKAACFIDSLLAIRLASCDRITTTDRVLDGQTDWLRGKKILLVDDAVISGTTLFRTREQLYSAGASRVDTLAFCVNREWWSPDLIQPLSPYLAFDDQATTTFCAELVSALSVLPRPYSVDFPLFTHIRVPTNAQDAMFTMPEWHAFDVSSSTQRRQGVWSITLQPSERICRHLDSHLSWPILSEAQLIKLRLYLWRDDKERSVYWCSLLPIVVLNPLRNDVITSLFQRLISHTSGNASNISVTLNSSSARLRAVQYAAAAQFGHLWIRELSLRFESAVSPRISLDSVRYLFPPTAAEGIRGLCTSLLPGLFASSVVEDLASQSSPLPEAEAYEVERSEPDVDALEVQARLTEPFLGLYREKEIPARRLVLQFGKEALNNDTYKNLLDRLRAGHSLPDLRSHIAHLAPPAVVSQMLSQFLDIAIDRGVVVPVTREHDGMVYRAYRHGEDILFTLETERLCFLMLSEFARTVGRTTIPRLWVEKLLVILVQVGVQQAFLTRWYGVLGADRTVGVRYALKGAVVHLRTQRVYSRNHDLSLTRRLVESGTLQIAEDGMYAPGKKPPTSSPDASLESSQEQPAPVRQATEGKVKILGSLFGMLLKSGASSRLSDRDLVLLSTCMSAESTAAALAAEIEIVSEQLPPVLRRIGSYDPHEAVDVLHRHSVYEAITSAGFKYRGYRDSLPREIVDRTAEIFDNVVYRETWRALWPSAEAADGHGTVLTPLIEEAGSWCLRTHGLIQLLFISLVFASEEGEQRNRILAEAKRSAEGIHRYCSKSKDNQRAAVLLERALQRTHDRTLPVDKVRETALEQLAKCRISGLSLVDRIDAAVGQLGTFARFTTFQHALYIQVRATSGQYRVKDLESVVVEHQRRAESDTVICDMGIGEPTTRNRYPCRWVCAAGTMGRRWLVLRCTPRDSARCRSVGSRSAGPRQPRCRRVGSDRSAEVSSLQTRWQ